MNWLNLCRSIVYVLMITVVGCKKQGDSSSAPADAAPSGGTPSVTAKIDDVVGQWKAATVDGYGPSSASDDMTKSLFTEKLEIFPDRTYRLFLSSMGRVHGSWILDGSALKITPDRGNAKSTSTYHVEPPHLVSREFVTIVYDKQGPAMTDRTPRYHMPVSDFQKEVQKDFAAAQKKYDGVLLELSGVVSSFELMASGPYVSIDGLRCSPMEAEPWATIGVKQPVKMVAIATLANGGVEFTEGMFTLNGPSVLLTTTAEDLAAQYVQDAEATNKKYSKDYEGKTVIITGTVLEKQIKEGTNSIVYLGRGGSRVECDYINDGWEVPKTQLAALHVGQKVKFAGEYIAQSSQSTPRLMGCKLITK